jgi:hypothetical protein
MEVSEETKANITAARRRRIVPKEPVAEQPRKPLSDEQRENIRRAAL